jgi:hypothetical protein
MIDIIYPLPWLVATRELSAMGQKRKF